MIFCLVGIFVVLLPVIGVAPRFGATLTSTYVETSLGQFPIFTSRTNLFPGEHEQLHSQGRIQGELQGLAIPNGNWHPCTFGAGAPISSPFATYFSPGSNFAPRGVVWAPFRQQRRPSDNKRRLFRPRRRPSRQISRPSRQMRRPSGTKSDFSPITSLSKNISVGQTAGKQSKY